MESYTGKMDDISFCYTCTHTYTKGEAPVNDWGQQTDKQTLEYLCKYIIGY